MKMNKFLFFTVVLLSIFGIIMIYSSSSIWAMYKFNNEYHYLILQSIFLLIGIIVMYIISKIDYKIYLKYSNIILIICFILLVLVLIPGIGKVRNGSQSWFGIGPFGIQPSEAAKIGLIIFTSKYLSSSSVFLGNFKKGVLPILCVLILVFGLIMLQPDLGTASVLFIAIIAMLFVSGVNMKFFVGMGITGLIGLVILIIIAPYRMDRITSFINPWKDPLGTGFQIIQSLYAIGPGGLLGQGFGSSIQKHFYLPEPQTDFIFSIITEEFGLVGAIIVVSFFLVILYNGFKVALNCEDKFGKYLAYGIIFQIMFQALMNLMVVIGMIPVTGVTLPFLSYGGSSLLISCASIGIILNISRK